MCGSASFRGSGFEISKGGGGGGGGAKHIQGGGGGDLNQMCANFIPRDRWHELATN